MNEEFGYISEKLGLFPPSPFIKFYPGYLGIYPEALRYCEFCTI